MIVNEMLKKLLYNQLYLEFYPLENENAVSSFINAHRPYIIRQAFMMKRRAEFMFSKRRQESLNTIGCHFLTGDLYLKDPHKGYRLQLETIQWGIKIEELEIIIFHLQCNKMITPEQLNHILYANRFRAELFYVNIDLLSNY